MKALLLRVGIDQGYGALSPIFADDMYEYIPIYYKDKKLKEEGEKRTYQDLRCKYRNDGMDITKITGYTNLSVYLPEAIREKKIHLDPEFETFTYGEPTFPKRNAILKLEKGDLLVFYLGGKNWDDLSDNEYGVYIFAYFVIDKIIDWNSLSEKEQKQLAKNELKNNAHIISSKPRTNLVVAVGDKKKSKKLKHCIKISEPNQNGNNPKYFTSREMKKLLGIRQHITRAIPLWITEVNYLNNLKQLLGIDKTDLTKMDEVGITHFINMINIDSKLTNKEKDFVFNFLTSAEYGEEADRINFESDLDEYNFKNTERIRYYFRNLYGKIKTYH